MASAVAVPVFSWRPSPVVGVSFDRNWSSAAKLIRSRVSAKGLIVAHYERDGEVKVDDTALGAPSDREIARRERIKREG